MCKITSIETNTCDICDRNKKEMNTAIGTTWAIYYNVIIWYQHI